MQMCPIQSTTNLHATKDYTNNGKYQNYTSGSAASREEGKNKYKRECKKLNETHKKFFAQIKSFKERYKSASTVKAFGKFGKRFQREEIPLQTAL